MYSLIIPREKSTGGTNAEASVNSLLWHASCTPGDVDSIYAVPKVMGRGQPSCAMSGDPYNYPI